MTAAIDTTVKVEPSAAWDQALELSAQSRTVETASTYFSSARTNIASELVGMTADAVTSALGSHVSLLDTTSSDITSLSTALDAFASSMSSVKTRLEQARADAAAADLIVSGDLIHAPEDTSDPDYDTKTETFNALSEQVQAARTDEDEAHNILQEACQSIGENIDLDTIREKEQTFSQALSWFSRAIIVVRWTAISSCATFKPRILKGTPVVGGQFMKPEQWKNLNWWKKVRAITNENNWVNKPYTRGTKMWHVRNVTTKAAPLLRRAGIATSVISGLFSAKDQYDQDSQTSMGEGKKVARAGVRGLAEAGGAYAGATVGAKAGAIAFAWAGPLGIAAGSVAGGLVGGYLGAGGGKIIADGVNAAIDNPKQAAKDAVENVGNAGKKAAEKVGGAIKDIFS